MSAALAWACGGLWGGAPAAHAQPQELRAELPGIQMGGAGKLRYWGFDVYGATLWVLPGFGHNDFPSHAFALELDYLRDFTARDIARRSLDEMRRQAPISAEQGEQWERALAAAFPDVKKGDRIAGVHRPGAGVQFLTNGKPTGAIGDAAFARLFFGIWLSPRTSEPGLRQALIAGTPP